MNASCYSTPFITYDEIKLHWDFEEDVTSDYDLHKYVYNNKNPTRNFTTKVLRTFCNTVVNDWEEKYGDEVIGFESLVELPRAGELYLKDKWTLVGQTKGFTCKRTKGKGTDNWSGKPIWDTKNLKPKLVFCKYRGERE